MATKKKKTTKRKTSSSKTTKVQARGLQRKLKEEGVYLTHGYELKKRKRKSK